MCVAKNTEEEYRCILLKVRERERAFVDLGMCFFQKDYIAVVIISEWCEFMS